MTTKAKKHAQRDDHHRPSILLSERASLNIDEFCAMVGIKRSTAYKAAASGDLILSKWGRRTLITKEEMVRFVKNMPVRRSQPR